MEISKLDFYPLEYHEAPEELQAKIRARSREFLKATMFCKIGSGKTFKYEGQAFVARRNIVSAREEDEEARGSHQRLKNIPPNALTTTRRTTRRTARKETRRTPRRPGSCR